MNETFPDANRANDIRRLKMLWYTVLPGGVVVVILALFAWIRMGGYVKPPLDESIIGYLPMIFVVALLSGIGLTLFLKARLPVIVARSPAGGAFQRASTGMFVLLGAADAPAFIGIGVYLMNPAEWLVAAIVLYAFAAAMFFKPDFDTLLSIEPQSSVSMT